MKNQSSLEITDSDLRNLGLFKNIPDELFQKLIRAAKVQSVSKGNVLASIGKVLDKILVVIDGELSLQVSKKNGSQVEIRAIYKDGIVGENPFLEDDSGIRLLCYSIVVSKTGSVLEISYDNLLKLCHEDTSNVLYLNLLRIFARQLSAAQARIHALSVYKVEQLLHFELCRIAETSGRKVNSGTIIQRPDHKDLALRIGCHRRVLISTLNGLLNTGQIVCNGTRGLILTDAFFNNKKAETL